MMGGRESPRPRTEGDNKARVLSDSSSPSMGQAAAPVSAVLSYAARGWPLFPLRWPIDGRCSCGEDCGRNAAKHPLTKNGVHDATTDASIVRRWWRRWPQANIGVATGNGLLVVDVDPRNGGDESLRDLERDLGRLPDTVTALTGGDGQHLFFAVDRDFKSKTGALGPGVDVKCAGGYVVVPPSRHVSGGVYEWVTGHAPNEVALAPLPPAIAANLKESERTPAGEVGESIAEGQRNDTLASLAGTMRRRGMTGEEIAAALLVVNDNRCDPPLPESEVKRIAASVAHYRLPEEEPEAAAEPEMEPPSLAALLGDVVTFIRRYVVLSDAQADALAIWTVHTHALEAAETTPYLSITSPEKRSGKTRLQEVLSLLAARPWYTGRVSAAVLVRKVAGHSPTLLLDESDAAFRGEKDYAEVLRAVLNSGHRRGGVASLCVKKGGDFELVDFPVFGPKAIAGIGRLPDTVADRAIPIRMKRRAPNESVARFRWHVARQEADAIVEGLRLWAKANVQPLQDARPDIPAQLDDRAADGWEPLLAIADAAGGDWPKRARTAAMALSVGDAREDDSLGVLLLRDIRAIFEERGVDRIASGELVKALVAMEEAPWGDLEGKPLDTRTLARLLRAFGIRPRQARFGEKTLKGYERNHFLDAWERYTCTCTTETSETRETRSGAEPNTDADSVSDVSLVSANLGVRVSPEDDESEGDDDTIPPESTAQRHLVVELGLELDFPNVCWPGGGIPGGRYYYEQAARSFTDADIEKAVAALEARAAERRGIDAS
jgi:hypothetical protein